MTYPELAALNPGSMVVAVYPVDGRRYRAKVEEIEEEGERRIFMVRYVDYGNVTRVGAGDLFHWDSLLEVIPAQAGGNIMQILEKFFLKIPVCLVHIAISSRIFTSRPRPSAADSGRAR